MRRPVAVRCREQEPGKGVGVLEDQGPELVQHSVANDDGVGIGQIFFLPVT